MRAPRVRCILAALNRGLRLGSVRGSRRFRSFAVRLSLFGGAVGCGKVLGIDDLTFVDPPAGSRGGGSGGGDSTGGTSGTAGDTGGENAKGGSPTGDSGSTAGASSDFGGGDSGAGRGDSGSGGGGDSGFGGNGGDSGAGGRSDSGAGGRGDSGAGGGSDDWPCDRDGDFLGRSSLTINQTAQSPWALHLTSDELTLVFTSLGDLYTSTRNDVSQEFTIASALGGVNTTADEWTVSVSGDGLALAFDTTRMVDPYFKIYTALRTSRTDAFTGVTRDPVLNVNTVNTSDGHPFLLPDGLVLYMVSTRNGSFDMFRAERSSRTAAFAGTAPLSTLNTTSREYFPVVTPDELTLYFASDRTDLPNEGGLDIFVSRRESKQENFGPPENVAELNTREDEYPNWISEDGCRLYFHTRTPTIEAFFARKPP